MNDISRRESGSEFSDEERNQAKENVRVILVGLAEKAYFIFDERLRNTNQDLRDFDPIGEQHRGNMEPKFNGLRPSYSKDWGGNFGFHAAVMSNQRLEMKRRRNDPTFVEISDLVDQYILSPGSGLVAADFPSPEIEGILDFFDYQLHINQTNTHASHAMEHVKRTLKGKKQKPASEHDEEEFYERLLEANKDSPIVLQIFKVIQNIRNLDVPTLKKLAQPVQEEFFQTVLQSALKRIKDEESAE